MSRKSLRAALSMLACCAACAFAPAAAAHCPTEPFTADLATRVVDQLDVALARYAIVEARSRVRAGLREARAALAAERDCASFVAAVNRVLFTTSQDLHLRLRIDEPRAVADGHDEDEARERWQAHGLTAVRRLPGNIGYLQLRYFAADDAGAATIDAAIGLLAGTDALIVDLRDNTGGGHAALARLLGHLAREPLPMMTIDWVGDDGRIETETRSADVPAAGPLFADRPVWVLTARKTFSAAEELAYDLQATRRATLVGETTRGGANPARRRARFDGGLSAFVPDGRTTHPVTRGNWEGRGVRPDVEVAADAALQVAYADALRTSRAAFDVASTRRERDAALADPAAALRRDATP